MKKRQAISSGCSVALAFWFITIVSVSAQPRVYPIGWNTEQSFGYDGPWHAVPMKIGMPEQTINLYPGGTWSSVVLGTNLSDSVGINYPNQTWLPNSDVWDGSMSHPSRHSSTENYDIAQFNRGGNTAVLDGSWRGANASNVTGNGIIVTDRMSFSSADNSINMENVSISALFEANMGFPDGRTVPMDVGFLSLGARSPETFGDYTANTLSQYLASDDRIPSNSWSLHIGSVAKGISGSLVMGGYDSSRAVGEVGTYDTTDGFGGMFATLLDIEMSVSGTGGSPWPFRNKTKLLRTANNNTQTIQVRPNPTAPFLFLPNDTCQTIASYLPVSWRWDLGLYTWNTDDPQYRKILTSPSYLGFVFQRSSGLSDLRIKVPLALLNLTLTSPIVDTPTAYFPCRPFDNQGAEYHLGRAFLQAAFLGSNWQKWWMAQAPGPGSLTTSYVSIENNTDTLSTAPSTFWAESWKEVLNDLPNPSSSASSSNNGNNKKNGSGISGGGIAGAVVGSVAGAVLLAGAIFFFLRSRRAKQSAAATAAAPSGDDHKEVYFPDRPHLGGQQHWPAELAGGEPPHEIMTSHIPPQELMANQQPPGELMANEAGK